MTHLRSSLSDEARRVDTSALQSALRPSSIAVIGASDNPNKVGGRPLDYLCRFGYGGSVYPINPNRSVVQGVPAFPDVGSLPEAPDLAVIAVPGPLAVQAVEDCAGCGVRVAIVMASGFAETQEPEAIAAEQRMVNMARQSGMRLVGPNSQGLANFGSGTVASFSTMFLETKPKDGPVGIVSQSGIMSVVPYGLLRERGIGVRHVHATGNDAEVGLPELALEVVRDPDVRVLLLYMEGIRDFDTLARAAETAQERGVPVVAIKSGRTAAGSRSAGTHTNAVENDDGVVDDFFRQHGVWRAQDPGELIRATELYLKGWRPERSRLAFISNSGASCVMAADAASELGLEMAELSAESVDRLSRLLPSFAAPVNPIDVTGALLTDNRLLAGALEIIASDPAADLLMIALPVAGAGYDIEGFAEAAAGYLARTHRPVVFASPRASVRRPFQDVGVPTFDTEMEGLAALSQLVHHTRWSHS